MSVQSAVLNQDVEALAKALKRPGSKRVLGKGLLLACSWGNAAMVDMLLAAGADPNWIHPGPPWVSAIERAASRPNGMQLLKSLVRKGADPNLVSERSQDRQAPIYSCRSGAAIRFLLEAGARVDVRDARGWPPLVYLAYRRETASVVALLSAGVEADQLDPDGNSALGYAELMGLKRMRQALKEAGASEAHAKQARAVIAARNGDLKGIMKFTDGGRLINHPGPWGSRILVEATDTGNAKLCQALVERGADVNLADAKGLTPLMAAARGGVEARRKGYLEIVKLLVEAGADVEAVANPHEEGDITALWYAREFHREDVVAYLRDVWAKRGTGSQYAAKRGIQNDGIWQRIVLVQADVDVVSREVASWLGGKVTPNVLEKVVHLGSMSFQVGQFRGHQWTFINPLAGAMTVQADEMAAALAQQLRRRALSYGSGEAHTVLHYCLCDAAGVEESLDYWKLYLVAERLRELPKDSPHRRFFEEIKAGKGVRFVSRLREVKRIKQPFRFANQFISRLGAFVPAFTPDKFGGGERIRMRYSENEPSDLVRMDLVSK